MKANLCMCNNCGNILIDHNAHDNAQIHDVNEGEYPELIQGQDIKDGAFCWICPICKTNAYLSDL